MKTFHCGHCEQLVFFENFQCIACDHVLGFVPELSTMASLEPAEGPGLWRVHLGRPQAKLYRRCANDIEYHVCNWLVADDDRQPMCLSCRLTRVIPNLSDPAAHDRWYRLEVAKRRLLYTLMQLSLPINPKVAEDDRGLAFEFLGGTEEVESQVMTGHASGVITVNVAEADDVERERRRKDLGEPFRTLLGHFRHEVGHYYWEMLITGSEREAAFRDLFGDNQADYRASLDRYYQSGPAPNWQDQFVSAYASAHPWEDWAETWAHYLHMVDAVETASACGLMLRPVHPDEPAIERPASLDARAQVFDTLVDHWFALTYLLNNLNRGLGLPDGYPFILSQPVREKLRFVHDTVTNSSRLTARGGGRAD